jgi:NADH:ubiquinone reductase (H+-translocating)
MGAKPVMSDVGIGAGFGGIEVARALDRAGVSATANDGRNHHLFPPLPYQVATAALFATKIAEPIRTVLRRFDKIGLVFGDVTGIDPDARRVRLNSGKEFPYHHLVLACRAGPSDFGKTIEVAAHIRSHLLFRFKRAGRAIYPHHETRLIWGSLLENADPPDHAFETATRGVRTGPAGRDAEKGDKAPKGAVTNERKLGK